MSWIFMAMSYYELLKHPNWQKKRLEIFDRAHFECEECGSKEQTLHIHHTYYQKGLAPWEYPDNSLICLCENCHKKAQDFSALLQKEIGTRSFADQEAILGYTLALSTFDYPGTLIDVFSYEVAVGVADYWGVSPEEVIDGLVDCKIDGYALAELAKKTKKRKKRL